MPRLFPTYLPVTKTACFLMLAALVAACTTPVRTVDKPSGPLPWSAAIGRLDAEDGSCSATLVGPDVILTASHCLYGRGNEARITDFQFTPALDVGRERLKPVKVTAVIDMGWPIKSDASGKLRGEPKDDWAALRISPAITYLEPMKVEKLNVDGIDARIKKGAKLSHAGYGVYGAFSGKRLQVRDNCHLVTDADKMLKVTHDIIVNRCEVIPGDSGGPIMLTDPSGNRAIVGVVTNLWGDHGQKDFVSFGPASIYFADKLGSNTSATSTQ
ncbi:MAG: trypsin-like serine protease [Proteobacteria bacterium]|nr:trypsin-like serine protease [Pseudomonadota bacterium]